MHFFQDIFNWFSFQRLLDMFHYYQDLGVFVGLVLPFLDAFLLVFPLVVVIAVNVAAYGFWAGFLVSWIGNTMGTLVVFFLLRRFGQGLVMKIVNRSKRNHPIMNWINRSGFGPIFIVLCFPFTPSFFVNVFAAVSKIRVGPYVLAVVLGKFVMIFSVSLIGKDVSSFVKHPLKLVVVLGLITLLWFFGKKYEKKMFS